MILISAAHRAGISFTLSDLLRLLLSPGSQEWSPSPPRGARLESAGAKAEPAGLSPEPCPFSPGCPASLILLSQAWLLDLDVFIFPYQLLPII